MGLVVEFVDGLLQEEVVETDSGFGWSCSAGTMSRRWCDSWSDVTASLTAPSYWMNAYKIHGIKVKIKGGGGFGLVGGAKRGSCGRLIIRAQIQEGKFIEFVQREIVKEKKIVDGGKSRRK